MILEGFVYSVLLTASEHAGVNGAVLRLTKESSLLTYLAQWNICGKPNPNSYHTTRTDGA